MINSVPCLIFTVILNTRIDVCQSTDNYDYLSVDYDDIAGSTSATEKITIKNLDAFKDELHLRKTLADWLLKDVRDKRSEYTTFDGWYNNPWQPSLGSVDSAFIRLLPSNYDDGVATNKKTRTNPFHISDMIMNMTKVMKSECDCESACSRTGKNVLMVFFGQFVVEEIINSRKPSCPLEYMNVEIPRKHDYQHASVKYMPFTRTQYDKISGISPNNPRGQINSATAWIDGSVIYGTSRSQSSSLRSYHDGTFNSYMDDGYYPVPNNEYLYSFVPYLKKSKIPYQSSFRIGNRLGHENPFILTFSVIFFRWHNLLAKKICSKNTGWNDEDCFNEARKWVIATLQHIIIDEWLPELIGEQLENYTRYDPSINPGISHAFQSAAMRFGQTLVPSAVYNGPIAGKNCEFSTLRICNSFYQAKEILLNESINFFLLGMILQPAEQENLASVDDLRKYLHGPPEFSRRDLMALNIQRGRDHGLPGYVTARNFMIPQSKVKGPSFAEMASYFNPQYKNVIEKILSKVYSASNDVDLWVGGLLETLDGPGPLFKTIIREQFLRIRDGDRFWFENRENGLFTDAQIKRIQGITMYDIIQEVTEDPISVHSIPKKVFHLPTDIAGTNAIQCTKLLKPYPCFREKQSHTCYGLPQLREECAELEDCYRGLPTAYDYFTGSGAMFILAFLSLFLFIIGCLLTLVKLVRMRNSRERLRMHSVKRRQTQIVDGNSIIVNEWMGEQEGTRDVLLVFDVGRKHLVVKQLSGQALRSIDLSNIQLVQLQVSHGSAINHILLRFEYDLVLKFDEELEKLDFIKKLETFLGNVGVGRQRLEVYNKQLLKDAVTKAHRQAQLEQFFRIVFAQAFSIEHERELEHLNSKQANEILSTELTPYEFAEALSLKPDALFVKQMFDLIDADGNGYISFREFLNVIIIFAKGTSDDKTKLLFDMYDIDHSGKLTRQEFSSMIRSLLELANQALPPDQMDHLITSMFRSAGLNSKTEMTFDDFLVLLAGHREELGSIQLSFDVGEGYKTGPTAPPASKRQSVVLRAQETVVQAYGAMDSASARITRQERGKSYIRMETQPEVFEKTVAIGKLHEIMRFVENYHLHIFWITLYTLAMFGLFIERAYYYSMETEHSGLRRIAGYGVTFTRGAASVMMLTYSTILLTMCRNTITFLRETFLHHFIPFDMAITFHKYIAFCGLMFTIIHVIGHGINFYHFSTQTPTSLTCIFPDFHIDFNHPPKFHYWLFQTVTGMTGVFLVIVLSLMYVFAIQYARRYVFNTFWATHNLYPVLYILMILHGLGHLIQDPIFYYFFVGPCVLFTVDRLISISRKKVEISVIKAELLPSGVTHLEFMRPANFEYKSGQWVRIACVVLNSNEYHPFTLSSAPHEENLSLHIRAIGPWTTNLRNTYDPDNLQQHAYPKIYLDGPYGEGHQDWFRYDVAVLVGGGIGITPFASILKDVVFKSNVRAKITCKKLYFIWVTRTQKSFEWMTDIIREVEDSDRDKLVDVHIFITQFYQKFDLRTTMLYICERHFQRVSGRSLFTGLRSITHFGRPDFKVFFESLQQEHPDVNKIAVFSCGPPQMTHNVQLSCEELNKHDGAIFVHHFENF